MVVHGLPRRFGQLDRTDVIDLERHDIAAAELAVDG